MTILFASAAANDRASHAAIPTGAAARAGFSGSLALLKAVAAGLADGLRAQRRYEALKAAGVSHADAARIAFDAA